MPIDEREWSGWPADDLQDYRQSAQNRRDNWFGLKRYAKGVLTLPLVNAALVVVSRKWIPADIAARLPVVRDEVDGCIGGARFVMLDPGRCTVAKEVFWGNGTRPRPRENLALELFAGIARGSDVVLDIGANTGIFTLVATAVNPEVQAHAFELVPEIFRLLFDNCVRNDILTRTVCHHYGVGRPGQSMVVPVSWGGSSLPTSVAEGMTFDEGVSVPFRALDDIVASIPPRSRVLAKIDVEGSELDVLRHGGRLLADFRPDILCEVLPAAPHSAEIQELLDPLGYRFYRVEDRALRRRARIEPHDEFWDWFFTVRDEHEMAAHVAIEPGIAS